MNILNLYAGIGGNRKLWSDNHNITAIEFNSEIANAYKKFFPSDNVIVTDAHNYLLNNYQNFDIIWSSPPCQTHSRCRFYLGFVNKNFKAMYPDLRLYEEILLLKHYFKGIYIVENVKPYYSPLIEPDYKLQRHYFWCNFNISEINIKPALIGTKNKISDFDYLGLDIKNTNIKNKRQVLRNCVNPNLSLHILNCAIDKLKDYIDKGGNNGIRKIK